MSNKLLTTVEMAAVLQSDLRRMQLTNKERAGLLGLLSEFFDRWEELHRVIPTGDHDKAMAASAALAEQAQAVRAFYG